MQLFQHAVDLDYILTCASMYWLIGTIGSSIRYYHGEARATKPTASTTAPTGVAISSGSSGSRRSRPDSRSCRWRSRPAPAGRLPHP